MKDVLAVIGLIGLYFLWLLSPFAMFALYNDGDDAIGRLVCIVYVGGALVIGYVLFKFVGLW